MNPIYCNGFPQIHWKKVSQTGAHNGASLITDQTRDFFDQGKTCVMKNSYFHYNIILQN